MIWTLRRILILIVLISSLAVIGTLVWVTATYQRFAIATQNQATGTMLTYLVRQRVEDQYSQKVTPFIEEWSRLSTLVHGMKEKAPDKVRIAANRMMHTLEVAEGRVRLRNVVVYDRNMTVVATSDQGSAESLATQPELIRQLKSRDLARQRVVATFLWRTDQGRPLHSTIAPIGGFQVAGFVEFVTDPVPELDGMSNVLGGTFRLVDIHDRVIFESAAATRDNGASAEPASASEGAESNAETLQIKIADALGGAWAFATLTRDTSTFTGRIQALRNEAIWIVTCVVLGSILFGWLLLRLAVFGRLQDFAVAMETLSQGNTDVALPESGPDEFRTMRMALESLRTAVGARNRAEAMLKASQEEQKQRADLLTEILESSPIGVTIELEDGKRWFVNQRQVENFGADSKETLLAADTGKSFVHPEDRARLHRMADDRGRNAYAHQQVLRRRLDGSTWWASMTKVPFDYEGAQAEIVWLRDVTRDVENHRQASLLTEAIDHFPDMVTLFDRDERVVFTNNRYHEIYPDAPPKDQIVGQTMEDLLRRSLEVGQLASPQARSDPEGWLQSVLTRRRTVPDYIGETDHTNGRSYEVRHWRTVEGGMILVQTDITARKRDHQALAAREAELAEKTLVLETMLDTLDQAIVIYDRDKRVALCNRSYAEVLGLPGPASVLGMTSRAVVEHMARAGRYGPGDPEALARQRFEVGIGGGARMNDIVEYADGKVYDNRRRRMPDGAYVLVMTEITGLVAAQRQAADAQALLQDALDNISDGFAVYDADHALLVHNRQFQHFWGYSDSDLAKGVTWDDLMQIDIDRNLIDMSVSQVPDTWNSLQSADYLLKLTNGRWYSTRRRATDRGGSVVTMSDVTEQKLVEEELRESEGRLTAMLEASPIGVSITGPGGRQLWVNQRVADMVGRRREELIGTPSEEYFATPARLPELRDLYRRDGTLHDEAVELRHADGSTIWVLMSMEPFQYGETAAHITWLYDITPAKEAEAALAKSESQLRAIIDNTPNAVYLKDPEGRYTLVNKAIAARQGYTPDEMVGLTAYDHFSRDIADVVSAHEAEVLASGQFSEREIQITVPGREPYIGLMAKFPVFDTAGEIAAIGTITYNITERKKAERELREARAAAEAQARLLRITLDNIGQGILVCDSDTRVVLWNGLASRFTGIPEAMFESGARSEERRLYQAANLRIDARAMEIVEEFDRRVAAGERDFVATYQRPGLTDSSWVHVNLRALPDGLTVRTYQDITGLKAAETEAREAQRFAEEANRAKSDFLSSMSHELRTPLNAVIGFSQYVIEDNKDPVTDEQRDCIGYVLKAGKHLLTLIDEVLDLAKIEAGAVPLSMEAVDTGDVIDECVSLTNSMAARRGIRLSNLMAGAERPPIHADRTRFKQIMLNLLSNAVKYNREGGAIYIEEALPVADRVRIAVRDTGIGIPADRLDKLFDPFDRLGAENSDVEGTGIGLTITKRLVEQMGGQIGVQSTLGAGTTFWVEFPISTDRPAEPTALDIVPLHAEAVIAGRILYVEDNPTNLELVRKIMSRHRDVRLIDAPSAELGLERARNEAPDVILMDINLPGMNGYEALDQLHMMPETRHIPVIAVTAAATSADIRRGQAAGFFDYLTKPIQAHRLIDTIARALRPADATIGAASGLLRTGKVLVVDDVPVNLAIAERQLAKLGIPCDVTGDPAQGLQQLLSGTYSLALVDISMPGMTGVELTERLREMERQGGRYTPVVALTASYGSEDELRRFRDSGMDGQLTKPVVLEELAAVLRRWIVVDVAETGDARREADTAPIDLAQLGEILGVDDAAEFKEMLALFVGYFPGAIERLEEALASRDAEETRLAAHAAKSTAVNAAARELAALLDRIESEAPNGDWAFLEESIGKVRPEFDRIVLFCEGYAREG